MVDLDRFWALSNDLIFCILNDLYRSKTDHGGRYRDLIRTRRAIKISVAFAICEDKCTTSPSVVHDSPILATTVV
jgi:hypothetical protein